MTPVESKSEPTTDAVPRMYRPKMERFRALTFLWIFPSLGAVLILGVNWHWWLRADSWLDALRATRLEQWIALALLALHGVFAFGARHYRRAEVPREVPPDESSDDPTPDEMRSKVEDANHDKVCDEVSDKGKSQ